MKLMKNISILMLSIILVFSFSTLLFAKEVFRLGHDHVVGSMPDAVANMFAKMVEDRSGGELKIDIYPASQLGNGGSIIEGVTRNTIDLTFCGGGWYVNFEDAYMATGFPFTFNDSEHFLKFLNSEKHQEIMEKLEKEKNMKYLAYHAIRLPRVILSKTPIFRPEDFVGKKMRVPAQRSVNEGWKAMGTNTVMVDWGEVYLAGRQGLMEITLGPFDSLYDAKFHEVFPYITWTQHFYTFMPFTMSKKRWDGLSNENQKILKEAAEQASDQFNSLSAEYSNESREKMMKEGAAFIHVDTQPFREKLAGTPERLEAEGLWEKGLHEYIRNLVK